MMIKRLLFAASLRHLFTHPLQLFLAILGIALGVAVVIAIDLASSSAERAFVATAEIFSSNVTHKIENSTQKIDEQQYVNLKKTFPQLKIAPVIERTVKKFNDKQTDAPTEYFRLFGIDPFSEMGFRNFSKTTTSENRSDPLFSLLSTANSVIISQQTAINHNLKIASDISIEINGKRKILVVIDIIQTDDAQLSSALNDVLIMDISIAQDVLASKGYLSRIELASNETEMMNQVKLNLLPGNQLIEIDNPSNALTQMTSAFRTNLQAMSLLAVMVGMFLIYNTMTFSVIQRRDTFATLRAIGATHREIFSVVLFEALLLGLIGTVLGLFFGMLLGKGLLLLVVRTINDLYFDLNLSQLSIAPLSMLKGFFLGIIATLISAWLPLREAFKTTPRENLNRSQLEDKKKILAPKLAIFGILLLLASLILISIINTSLVLSFFVLFLIFIGYALMVPFMVIKIVKFLRKLHIASLSLLPKGNDSKKHPSIIVTMSLGNITNSLSRTGAAMTALTLAVATTVGVTIMVDSFRHAVQEWQEDILNENIYLFLPTKAIDEIPGLIKRKVAHTLKSQDEIKDISIRLWTTVRSELGKKSLFVQQIPDFGFDKYTFLGDTHLASFKNYQTSDNILISEPLATKNKLQVGDTLMLHSDRGEKKFQIIGIYRDYSTDQGMITISRNIYSKYWINPGISSFGVYLKPNRSATDLIKKLRNTIRDENIDASGPINIISNDEILKRSMNIFDQTFAITNVLRILTIIVAFIGILSAFMALQLERSREFATLRTIGLTPRQLLQGMLLETSTMGCIAGILAIPLGIILATVLILFINIQSFGWSMAINLNSADLLFAILFSMLAALLAGFHPAYKMTQQAPAVLLRNE